MTLTRHRQLLGLRRSGAAVDASFSELANLPVGKLLKKKAIFFHPVQLPTDAAIAGHAQSHCRPMALSGLDKCRICEVELSMPLSPLGARHPILSALQAAAEETPSGLTHRCDHALPVAWQLQADDAGRAFQ